MTVPAAHDFAAIAAGLRRVEEEKRAAREASERRTAPASAPRGKPADVAQEWVNMVRTYTVGRHGP